MRFGRSASAGCFVATLFALSMFILGLRGIKLETMTLGGTIAAVSENRKSIVIHGATVSKIMISSGTKILDEKGTILGISSLRSGLSIEVEGLYNPKGPFFAKKIIVKAPKQKP